jgi:hypothetical protein
MAYVGTIGVAKSRFGVSLPLLVGLLVFTTLLLSGTRLLGDPDTYWHIVAGRWIIAHRAVPHFDFFSNSMPGAPWVAHEWLAEVATAAIFDNLGWAGLVVAAAAAFALAMAALTRTLLRFLEPVHALAGMATAWGMCLPHLLARPHTFAMPLMALWLGALVEARSRGRTPAAPTALVMLVWANLHGGYMLGLVLAALFGAEAVASAGSWRAVGIAAREWALFGTGAVAAALITPNGIAGLWLPFHLMRMPFAMSVLMEWQSPNFQEIQPLEIWLLAAFLGALALGVRLPWTRVLMLGFLLHLALGHVRNAEVLGLAAPFILAEPVAAEIRRLAPNRGRSALDGVLAELAKPAGAGGAALAAIVAFVLGAVPIAHGLARGPDPFAPSQALAAVAAAHVEGPVLNDYGFGGYLIFSGIAPFIDGRADMYGDAFLKRYVEATHGLSPDLPQLLDEFHISWTLLEAKSTGVTLMDHLPGWQRLYADDIAVVHIRKR